MVDKALESLLAAEVKRQNEGIELIASENYPSKAVREACSSILMAKYAEGYPGKRYYGGCENVDAAEELARTRACALFHAKYANVQPHSGSQANFAAYRAFLEHGDKILSLALNDGGHLTHGSNVSFSANTYRFAFYELGPDGHLDYQSIKRKLDEENPNLFLAGYSAYSYDIDFKKMRDLVDEHNRKSEIHCYFMVDMAHIAGIVAAGLCQNPVEYADVVTSTTHKTLRGPRGGLILSNNEAFFKKLDSAVFPYSQGGPLEHIIGAKAVCFLEDLQPSFKEYMARVLENTKACSDALASLGAITSGTDNHLFQVNVLETYGLTGKEAQIRLEEAGITVNKNMIHGDQLPPSKTSGLRIGFAAATSRGCSKEDAVEIAHLIHEILTSKEEASKFLPRSKAIAARWQDVMSLDY